MYASTTIANTIVRENPGRTLLGIIKLTYLVHGWALAHGAGLVSDLPQYCEFGPVHPAVYDQFRHLRGGPIDTPAAVPGALVAHLVPDHDVASLTLVRGVVDVHRPYTDIQLSNYAHGEGTPWSRARRMKGFSSRLHTDIPEAEILQWFAGRLALHALLQAA